MNVSRTTRITEMKRLATSPSSFVSLCRQALTNTERSDQAVIAVVGPDLTVPGLSEDLAEQSVMGPEVVDQHPI
jgi:hypothetical protein